MSDDRQGSAAPGRPIQSRTVAHGFGRRLIAARLINPREPHPSPGQRDLVDFSRTQLGVGINVVPAKVNLEKLFRASLICNLRLTQVGA